jgi:hypothetical protein
MFDGMMKILKITCKDVYPLISESRDHPLPFISRVRLKFHLTMCGLCQIYQNQLEVLCKVARKLGDSESKVLEETDMKPEAKEKIQKWIKEKS